MLNPRDKNSPGSGPVSLPRWLVDSSQSTHQAPDKEGRIEGENQNINYEQKGKLIFLAFQSGKNTQQLIGTVKMLTIKGEEREGIVSHGGKRATEVIRHT